VEVADPKVLNRWPLMSWQTLSLFKLSSTPSYFYFDHTAWEHQWCDLSSHD